MMYGWCCKLLNMFYSFPMFLRVMTYISADVHFSYCPALLSHQQSSEQFQAERKDDGGRIDVYACRSTHVLI